MAKIKVRKDVMNQMTSKLKTQKNDNIKPEFAEKLQKSALNSQNEQITSKIQANKNEIYFETFDLNKSSKGSFINKLVYVKRKKGANYWRNQKVRADAYELGKQFQMNEDAVQYKRLDLANKCKYVIKNIQPLQISRKNFKTQIKNAYAPIKNKVKNHQLFCNCLGKEVVGINDTHEFLKKDPKTKKFVIRDLASMQQHAGYIPFIIPVLEHGIYDPSMDRHVNGDSHEIVSRAEIIENGKKVRIGISVVVYETKNQLEVKKVSVFRMTDKYRLIKSRAIVPDGIDKECLVNGLNKSMQHNSNIAHCNNLSSKNVTKSLTISDRLFRLWQRRLSPELQKEMQKYVDENSRVYSLFPGYKDVCEIKGYPKGLDLENNILLELGDTYFVVSCGGDWQDEKLVKFSIGEDDKLKAEVVDKCDKEDKRVLNKKLAYIINPTEINKSLTYSGHKLQGRTRLYGMDISIENKKGSYRSGVDKDGHKWKVLMHYDYGYIRGTVGVDGDHEDCYIGPDKNAEKVYVIHQNDPVTHKYDEDKCMLCFSSAADAKAAYMKQYDRPGFYGSMTTMTIDEFKSFIFSHKGKMVHKSFDINITDITENNKQQKLEQVNKALNAIANNQPFMIKHIPADASTSYGNLLVRITDFDKSKIEKAVHKIALSLDSEIKAGSKGETFVYKAQEELVDKYFKEFTNRTRAIYNFVIGYFNLPDIRIVSKAGELKYKGKILYNPETGKPIKESEWKRFIVELEKFLNRNYTGIGEKIVLSAESLGIILDRLSKTNSLDAIRKMSVADLKAKRYDVDWISDSVKNMKDKFGEVISRERQARIQIACDSAAQRVTRVKDDMRNNIQQIIIDGIRDKQSKSVVAQHLFDKCASLNRDMQRIADTEVQMATSRAYIKEEVYNTPENEKVYFKRFEMLDDNTCKKCRKINGKIVLWSDVALPDEHIKDEYADIAIWEGKTEGDYPESVLHPWCRGAWIRYYPEV